MGFLGGLDTKGLCSNDSIYVHIGGMDCHNQIATIKIHIATLSVIC